MLQELTNFIRVTHHNDWDLDFNRYEDAWIDTLHEKIDISIIKRLKEDVDVFRKQSPEAKESFLKSCDFILPSENISDFVDRLSIYLDERLKDGNF